MRYLEAKNLAEFTDALKYWGEPGENQIFADTTGQIGWFPSGFVPVRRTSDGLLPLPGDGRYEWDGIMDRSLLPSEVDPARRYVATANQLNLPQDYPYQERRVSFTWYQGDRFERISEVLDALPKVSIRDSEALQNDYLTIPGRRLVAVLKSVQTTDPVLKDAVAWLAAWDGRATAESPQAALFEVWISHYLAQGTFARAVPAIAASLRAYSSGAEPVVLGLMEHPDARLGPNPIEARDAIVLETLAKALTETSGRLGPDRSQWQWGQLASVRLDHPLAGLADGANQRAMTVGPAPKAGDGSTVGAAYYHAKDFRLESGASFRMVLDVGNWDESVAVNTPGESGDWSSPHYRDLFPLWLDGKYFPLAYTKPAVAKATERTLHLVPR
jgi:penicillin amidase